MKFILLLVILFFFPVNLHAAVIINEVAWMGSVDSANDEWIELYNNGGSESLDGWTLSDGQNLSIILNGTLAGNSYGVLERTDESSAPGSAFLIYTGALGNDGRTLTLYKTDGSVADRVVGGTDWTNIGGDNTTKETAQYTQNGWVTAVPSPGSYNNQVDSPKEEDDETEKTSESASVLAKPSKTTEPVKLILPDVTLVLSIDSPDIVYVNQPVKFDSEPSGLGDTIMDSLVYTWNFGDLYTASGKSVGHSYSYPGEYIVMVNAKYTRHEQTARKKVLVLPVTFSLGTNSNGDILLNNNAKYEVDISGYRLKAAGPFTFPENTVLLPNATIVVKKERIGAIRNSKVTLHDQAGELVAINQSNSFKPITQTLESENQMETVRAQETNIMSTSRVKTTDQSAFSFATPGETNVETEPGMVSEEQPLPESEEVDVNTAAVGNSSSNIPREALPYLGLIGVLAVGIAGVYMSGQKSN